MHTLRMKVATDSSQIQVFLWYATSYGVPTVPATVTEKARESTEKGDLHASARQQV